MKVENYVTLEFLSRSTNEAFAGLPRQPLPRSWILRWTRWGISEPPSVRR